MLNMLSCMGIIFFFSRMNVLKDRGSPIDEKMRESRLRWFGYVQRRASNVLVRKNELIQVEGTKKRVEEDQKSH